MNCAFRLILLFLCAVALFGQITTYPSAGGGGGGATIPSVTNLISGNGSGNGADSGIVPANVALLNGVNVFTNNFSVTNGGSNGYSLFGASQVLLPLNATRDHFYFGFNDTITGNSRGLTQVYEFSGVSSSGGIKNGLSANANTVNTTTGALTNTGSGGFAGGRFLVQHEGSGLVSRASAITGRVTESSLALGTITDVATINAEAPILDAAQTWTSHAGLRVNSAATIGTITTNYGVRVDSLLSGATKWAYYAQTDPSFFGGAVTTPNLTLSSLTTGIAHVGSGGAVTSSAILDAEVPTTLTSKTLALPAITGYAAIAHGDPTTTFQQNQATINTGDTTITVTSTTGWPTAGMLVILEATVANNEIVTYTGVTSTTFTGLTRSLYGTTATTHTGAKNLIPINFISAPSTSLTPDITILRWGNGASQSYVVLGPISNLSGANLPGSLPVFMTTGVIDAGASGSFKAQQFTSNNIGIFVRAGTSGANTISIGDNQAQLIALNGGGGVTSVGGPFLLKSYTFATLPSTGIANGWVVYCSDCKNVTDDTTGIFDSVAAASGNGTMVLRENASWRVH